MTIELNVLSRAFFGCSLAGELVKGEHWLVNLICLLQKRKSKISEYYGTVLTETCDNHGLLHMFSLPRAL